MPASLDLLVRGGLVVTPEGVRHADVGVADGRIVQLEPELDGAARGTIDAQGRYVFPGVVDAHVHFNEPGRSDWEGLVTGPAALAAGGVTCFFDMPLNSDPPVLDAATLGDKRACAEARSCLDFALWGGLTPLNLDAIPELAAAGAIGLKAFMCESGIGSFPAADARTLREGMKRAAAVDLPVAVHAEDQAVVSRSTAALLAAGRDAAASWAEARPVEAETTAIRIAVELAGETGCAVHVVHVSCPEGLAVIHDARSRGADVTAETCPHYLLLNADDTARIGAAAKCAPPLRDETRRRALWAGLRSGNVETIGSDHSPAPPHLKDTDSFFAAWGGVAGGQHGFELLASECAATAAQDLPLLAAVLARNVARRFRVDGRKGRIAVGYDADFSVLDLRSAHEVRRGDLRTRHPISPYVGRHSRARVGHLYVRGCLVHAEGRWTDPPPAGRFVRPGRCRTQ